MGPHSTYLYDDKSLCAVGSVCKRFHVPMHIHMQETKSELENSVAGNHAGANCHRSDQKCSPIANLARLGLLDGTICAHCVHVLDSDIALLQKHGASVVHCPRSNLKLGSGLAPVQRMLDMGVNVCLGTDGASSNNSLDMLSELRTAALIAPIAADGDATAVTAVTVGEEACSHAGAGDGDDQRRARAGHREGGGKRGGGEEGRSHRHQPRPAGNPPCAQHLLQHRLLRHQGSVGERDA